MHPVRLHRLRLRRLTWFWLAFTSGTLISCAAAQRAGYQQTNLVSNTLRAAAHTQRSLVTPWGLAVSPEDGFGIVNSGVGTFATYDAAGNELSLVARVAGTAIARSESRTLCNRLGPNRQFHPPGQVALPGDIIPFLFASDRRNDLRPVCGSQMGISWNPRSWWWINPRMAPFTPDSQF